MTSDVRHTSVFYSPVTPVLQRCSVRTTPVPPVQVHLLRYLAMTEELLTSDLTCMAEETLKAPGGGMDCNGSIFSPLDGVVKRQQVSKSPTPATNTVNESEISSGECDLCVEHEFELDWFCGTEQKVVCSGCAIVGSCQGHAVAPLADRVTAVRVSVWRSL